MTNILPTCLKNLSHSSTAFRETGITNTTIICQHLTSCRFNRFHHIRVRLPRNALITLAMVICTDIETMMCLIIVPTDNGGRMLLRIRRCKGSVMGSCVRSSFKNAHQPTARYDRMSLQQLQRGIGAHFAADDAGKIGLHRHDIHCLQ